MDYRLLKGVGFRDGGLSLFILFGYFFGRVTLGYWVVFFSFSCGRVIRIVLGGVFLVWDVFRVGRYIF